MNETKATLVQPHSPPPHSLPHQPVLLAEVLASLPSSIKNDPPNDESDNPPNVFSGGPWYLDLTAGRGGHAHAIMSASSPKLQSVLVDQDTESIVYLKQKFASDIQQGKVKLFHQNFSTFPYDDFPKFSFILVDLGVSSPQLDQASRGFSFYHEGPLDMRMNQSSDVLSAGQLIQDLSEDDLINIFQKYGEIRSPYRVVRAIVHDRKLKTFQTTRELAGLIERVEGWRKKGFHPATQYFQALRIAVNDELGVLERSLDKWICSLAPAGRLAVISFHSLEDRIVKNKFKESLQGRPVNKKVIMASREEELANPRSRSSKLRIFENTSRTLNK